MISLGASTRSWSLHCTTIIIHLPDCSCTRSEIREAGASAAQQLLHRLVAARGPVARSDSLLQHLLRWTVHRVSQGTRPHQGSARKDRFFKGI